MQQYRNVAGATPNETISDSESIFFPKPNSSCLFNLRATQPSVESNMIAMIIKIAAILNSWLIENIIAKNPEIMLHNDMISDSAIKFFICVSSIFIFKPM